MQFFDIGTAKSGPTLSVFNMFTCKCASRHDGVQFSDIGTAKSGPTLSVFQHFHLQMCFSPQRRAIFDFFSDRMTPHPPLERSHSILLRHAFSILHSCKQVFDHVSRSHLVALQTGPLEKQLQTRFNTAVCCLRHEGRWLRYRLRLSA